MSVDETTSRTRRALLSAAVAAAAATTVAAVSRPLSAAAADGDPLILGQPNQADTPTALDGQLIVNSQLVVRNFDPDPQAAAVIGNSAAGAGVHGTSTGSSGILSSGVHGGASKFGGIGVSAEHDNPMGTALLVRGKVQLRNRSGRATVAAGKAFVDVDLRLKGRLSGTPLCFANLTSYRPGVHVAAVRPNTPVPGKARIYLNRAVTSNTFVAWLVLD